MSKKNPQGVTTVEERPWLKKRFKVPYNHDLPSYKDTVIRFYKDFIDSVYMAPPTGLGSSARVPMFKVTMDDTREALKYFKSIGIESWITLNGAWNPPSTYSSSYFSVLASALLDLKTAGLDGIIVGSSYLANAGFIQKHVPGLKILPTVNNMFDSVAKADTATRLVDYDGVIWDRNLNPDIAKLEKINQTYKAKWPGKVTELMLNEGCLQFCPFKRDHDQILSMNSYSDPEYFEYLQKLDKKNPEIKNINANINTLFGCYHEANKDPNLLNSIPYIDSLNLQKYDKCGDIFKLAGRTHQSMWITRLLKFYIDGKEALPRYMLDSGLGGTYPGGEKDICM